MEKTRRLGLPAKFLLALGGLFVVAHIAATLAFTGPQTPLKASLQPALNKYFLGPLDQGWSLFAPGVYSQNEYYLMRACLSSIDVCAAGTSAGAEFSEWRNVTEEELALSAGNIFSNRGTKQSKTIHGRYWSAAHDLSEEQRQIIAQNHIQGEPVFGVELTSHEAKQKFSASELKNMRAYEQLEKVAVGFATLYAKEQWGEKASIVEIRMLREPVTRFSERHNPPGKPTQIFTKIGWRDMMEFDEETLAAWK